MFTAWLTCTLAYQRQRSTLSSQRGSHAQLHISDIYMHPLHPKVNYMYICIYVYICVYMCMCISVGAASLHGGCDPVSAYRCLRKKQRSTLRSQRGSHAHLHISDIYIPPLHPKVNVEVQWQGGRSGSAKKKKTAFPVSRGHGAFHQH